ncbi:MAG TPA: hypothetical protein VFD89_00605, partial [Clostridia bacterium]|nr:hypothetical protein [Clostridia bacterium]
IEATNVELTEDDIQKQIKKLNGKGAVTMSILQKREEIGRRAGRREGRQEGLERVARNLLKEGMEIALVIKTTGLSKAEVEKLKEVLDS